jgi:hypothetical protein
MIDFNNEDELRRIRTIKEYPAWNDYMVYVQHKIDSLSDIDTINTIVELEARKQARNILKDILEFMK